MVGIELGAREEEATRAHVAPRVTKALMAGRSLCAIAVPTGVAAQMWRTAVLPQALYGCEIRCVTSAQLEPVRQQGRTALQLSTSQLCLRSLGPQTLHKL